MSTLYQQIQTYWPKLRPHISHAVAYIRASAIRTALVLLSISVLAVSVLIASFTHFKREDNPTPTALILQQSYDNALPHKPIDQKKYQMIIQNLWDTALKEGSTHIVNFPHDPALIAFQYTVADSPEPIPLVLYRNKPLIVRTKKSLDLPTGQSSRISLSAQNYQLVVSFEYADTVKSLELERVLAQAFSDMIKTPW